MDMNTVEIISQMEISNKIPICKLNDCSSPAKIAKATMLFSSERMPMIWDKTLLRLIIKKRDKNIIDSERDNNGWWPSTIVVRGVNAPECATAVSAARVIKVRGTLR